MKATKIAIVTVFLLGLAACTSSTTVRLGTPVGVQIGGSSGPGHCPPGQAKKGNC